MFLTHLTVEVPPIFRNNHIKIKTKLAQDNYFCSFLLRIRKVSGSKFGPRTSYPNCGFGGFPQFLQTNVGVVP